MKLLLTSFGIEQELDGREQPSSIFYQMPPVSFRWMQEQFIPDYDLLLLCDGIVMDERSFQKLSERPVHAYAQVADTFKALRAEGRIELVDFRQVLRENEDLLSLMVDHDVKALDQWIVPLKESLALWSQFSNRAMDVLHDAAEAWSSRRLRAEHNPYYAAADETLGIIHRAQSDAANIVLMAELALASSAKRKRREYRKPLREVLRTYLRYVNANIILSNELQVGFHDWLDFIPFYGAKFLSVGKSVDPIQEQRKQVEKLFTISFPEMSITGTRSLLRVLNDKRVGDLRQLISDAAAGKVQFDEEFAKSVLREVLRVELSAKHWRNIVGYLTLPMGFIPGAGSLAEKALGEAAGHLIDHRLQKEHTWFYMLSELADHRGIT